MKLLASLFITLFITVATSASDNHINTWEQGALFKHVLQTWQYIPLQANGDVVTPQTGEIETDKVWVNRSLWIGIVLIIIVLYLLRRKKQ